MPTRAEDAVRQYLIGVRDPAAVKTDTTELDARIEQSEDPLERLQLHAEKARLVDPMPRLEEEFVTHAKAYAEERGIPAEAFRAEGVPTDVLRRAGFAVGRGGRRRGAGPGGRTRSRVTAEEVRKALPRKKGTFTIAHLRDATGASQATVRKLVSQLITEGSVEEIGPDPDSSGPGRSPTLYRRVG